MDRETLELIVHELTTLWRQPIGGRELAVWRRVLRPDAGQDLDEELAVGALLELRHLPQFATIRPSVAIFLSTYDRMAKADSAATAETVSGTISRCRSVLSDDRQVRNA
jgi:hypothetical protein